MNYVLDTNVILLYMKDAETKRLLEEVYGIYFSENRFMISIVTIAELFSLGMKNGWGERRIKAVKKVLDRLILVEIRFGDLVDAYVEIDAFSQGRLKNRPAKFTARNMGKNDLWIAATTHVTNSKLITADKDFEHLDGEFFDVILIER